MPAALQKIYYVSAKKGHRLWCPFCLQFTLEIAAGEWEKFKFFRGDVDEALALVPLTQTGIFLDDAYVHL